MPNNVVVITGASGGIGAALARELGANGYALVLAARREDELHKVALSIRGDVLAIPTDVTERNSVRYLFEESIRHFGKIDVWINNAGRGITKRALDLTDDDIDDMIRVNVKSALYGMQAVVPHFMEKGAGHLVNVSSFLAKMPMAPMRSAYSAAKAALNSLTETMRFDLGATYPGIHFTVVMPGLVATEFAKNAAGENAVAAPPPKHLPPPQTAEEVAKVIADVLVHPRDTVFTNPANVRMLEAKNGY
jgi:short-subunit dehydrogenase